MTGAMFPSLKEFRECVLAAYAPILRDMGFAELPKPRGEYANKFVVRIGNATTVIEVEGINWGMAAWTKVFRASEADANRYGLPIGHLLERRKGLSTEHVTRAKKRWRELPGQVADIRNAAIAIIELAKDILAGDFSELDEIAGQLQRLEQERLARALPEEQKAAAVASSEAGHAFKRGEFRKVVELLEPHLPNLPPSQRKRYEIARGKAGLPL